MLLLLLEQLLLVLHGNEVVNEPLPQFISDAAAVAAAPAKILIMT